MARGLRIGAAIAIALPLCACQPRESAQVALERAPQRLARRQAYTVGRASQVDGSPRREARATQRPTGPGAGSLSASRSLKSAR